jgi:hypothetical protein
MFFIYLLFLVEISLHVLHVVMFNLLCGYASRKIVAAEADPARRNLVIALCV